MSGADPNPTTPKSEALPPRFPYPQRVSRNLSDDFDEDDPAKGSLDLEKGGRGVGTGASTSYDGGMEFDDDPYGDGPQTTGGALELDLPRGSATALRTSRRPTPELPGLGPAPSRPERGPPPAGQPSPASSARPTASGLPSSGSSIRPGGTQDHGTAPGSRSGAHAASSSSISLPPPRRTAAAVIAKYPETPQHPWQTPKYAAQVLLRQFELRNQLESLRRRRSPDVPLYEAALRFYDAKAFRLGMALNGAIVLTAMFLFFLPVILRFARAD